MSVIGSTDALDEVVEGRDEEELGLEALLDEMDPSAGDHEAEVSELIDIQFGPEDFVPEPWEEPADGQEWPDDEDDASVSAQDAEVPGVAADEFLCAGCFLIMHRRRLADPAALLCPDCAAVSGAVR